MYTQPQPPINYGIKQPNIVNQVGVPGMINTQ